MSAARLVRHAKRDRSPSVSGAGDVLPDIHHASQFSIGAGTPTASVAAVNDSCAASKKCSPHLPAATIPIVSSVGDQITAVVSTPELPADDLRAVALIAASPRPPRPHTKPTVSASPVPSGAPLWAMRALPRQLLAHLPDAEDEDGAVRSLSAIGGDDGAVRSENCGASPRPASCDYSPRSAMASVSRSSSGSSWGDEGWGMSSAMTGFGQRQQRSSPAPTAALAAFRKGPGFVQAFGPRPWASSQENSNSNTVTDPSSQFQHVPVSSGVAITRARSASATVRFSSALELRHAGWDSTPCQQTTAGLAVEPPRLVRSKYFVARRSSDGALLKIPALDATLSSMPNPSQPGAQRGNDCRRALVFSQTSSDGAAQLSSASQGSNRATNRGVSNIFPAWPCPTYSLQDDHVEHTMGRDMKHRFSSSRSRSVEHDHQGQGDSQASSAVHVNGGCEGIEGIVGTSCLRAVPSSVAAAIATVPTEFTTARGSPWRVTAAALKFAKDQFAQIEIQHSPLRSPQSGDGSCDKNGVSLLQRQPRSAQATAMLHGHCTEAPPKARGADYDPYDLTGTSTMDEDDAVRVEDNGGWRQKRSAAIGTENARVGIDHQKNLADLADCMQRTKSAPLRSAVSHNSQGIDSEPFTCCQPKATATAEVPHSPEHHKATVVCDESSSEQSFFDKPATASRKQQLRRKRHRAADEDDSPCVPVSGAASADGVRLSHCEDEGSSGETVVSMASKGPLMEDRMLSPRHYTVPDGFETHPSEETVGHPAVLAQSSHYVGFTTAGGRMLCLRRNIRGAYG